MDYSKIQTLNANLKYTNIKGKNYITVNQRVLAFRELYPGGRIVTEIVKLSQEGESTAVIVKASIFDGEVLISTGHAFENTNKNVNINKFSALENCETSAVGRALGFLGIGSTDSIASLEEVQTDETMQAPETQQPQPEKITPENLAKLSKLYQGESLNKLLDYLKVSSLEELDDKTAVALLAKIAQTQKAKKGAK